ncbi:MAG: dimethylsulfonioproprionate lyase DddP [Pseudomonadota bacterium]
MNQHFSETRKVLPLRPDGTPDNNDRTEIGPTPLAFAEWSEAGLEIPNLPQMRSDRHARLVKGINDRGYGGALFFDPLNIRFATDSTNMQLWNAHNPFRAVFIGADGYMVLFDFKGGPDKVLSDFNPLVREVRRSAAMFYFVNGDKQDDDSHDFVAVMDELMHEHAPNKRLAIDKIAISGYRAFTEAGYTIEEGEELSEKVRAIKQAEEIKALRCSCLSTEIACALMEKNAAPGMTEDEIWAVMHAENILRGGEWIECRLLSSGPRTNPWFQECGPRIVQNGDIVAYDTDLVGPYGMCCDISRTFWVGDGEPTAEMKRLHRVAREHIEENTAILRPGMSFREITFSGHMLADEFVESRYGCKMHGVGLCDEWPFIAYPEDWREGAFDYVLEPGMMLCVEALIAHKGGDFSIKLEDQVLITETGHDVLTRMPHDPRFL